MIKPSHLIFVFILSFLSFLSGWLVAVFVLPGGLRQPEIKNPVVEESSKDLPFFEEMKENILTLFDPYKMDALSKKDTSLGKNSSFIKKSPDSVQIKSEALPESEKDKKIEELPNLTEEEPETDLTEEKEKNLNPELQKIQEDYDKKNMEQLLIIEKAQKFFKSDGNFSFLLNVFSTQDKAFEYVENMKEQYPMWSFFMKAHEDHIRIYLGPFPARELALEFKNALPVPNSFSSLEFLEEVGL